MMPFTQRRKLKIRETEWLRHHWILWFQALSLCCDSVLPCSSVLLEVRNGLDPAVLPAKFCVCYEQITILGS